MSIAACAAVVCAIAGCGSPEGRLVFLSKNKSMHSLPLDCCTVTVYETGMVVECEGKTYAVAEDYERYVARTVGVVTTEDWKEDYAAQEESAGGSAGSTTTE
jgi:hypothetical protein